MSKRLEVTIDLGNAAFEDDRGEAGRILRQASLALDVVALGGFEVQGHPLRDVNGNKCGSLAIVDTDKPRRLLGHCVLIGGRFVSLWPVERTKDTPEPDDSEPFVVLLRHTENDFSEPYQIELVPEAVTRCGWNIAANCFGWAYCSEDVSADIEANDAPLELKRRDREALRDCGSANAEMLRNR